MGLARLEFIVNNNIGVHPKAILDFHMRTLAQAERVTKLLAQHGLKRGKNGLRLIMMCEVPSNAILADEFLKFFDGFSIGSDDLTQLALGLDRDSGLELQAADFDEGDPAVQAMLSRAINACRTLRMCLFGIADMPASQKGTCNNDAMSGCTVISNRTRI